MAISASDLAFPEFLEPTTSTILKNRKKMKKPKQTADIQDQQWVDTQNTYTPAPPTGAGGSPALCADTTLTSTLHANVEGQQDNGEHNLPTPLPELGHTDQDVEESEWCHRPVNIRHCDCKFTPTYGHDCIAAWVTANSQNGQRLTCPACRAVLRAASTSPASAFLGFISLEDQMYQWEATYSEAASSTGNLVRFNRDRLASAGRSVERTLAARRSVQPLLPMFIHDKVLAAINNLSRAVSETCVEVDGNSHTGFRRRLPVTADHLRRLLLLNLIIGEIKHFVKPCTLEEYSPIKQMLTDGTVLDDVVTYVPLSLPCVETNRVVKMVIGCLITHNRTLAHDWNTAW